MTPVFRKSAPPMPEPPRPSGTRVSQAPPPQSTPPQGGVQYARVWLRRGLIIALVMPLPVVALDESAGLAFLEGVFGGSGWPPPYPSRVEVLFGDLIFYAFGVVSNLLPLGLYAFAVRESLRRRRLESVALASAIGGGLVVAFGNLFILGGVLRYGPGIQLQLCYFLVIALLILSIPGAVAGALIGWLVTARAARGRPTR